MHLTKIAIDRSLSPTQSARVRYRAYEQPMYRRAYDGRPLDPSRFQVTPYDDIHYEPPRTSDYLVIEPESTIPTQLGPFSTHLNVIFGTRGSGKTQIANHIRDLLMGQAKVGANRSSAFGNNPPISEGYLQLEDGIRRYRLRNDRAAGAVRVEHRLIDGQEFPDTQLWDESYKAQDWRQIPGPLLEVLLQTNERRSLNDHDPDVMHAIHQLSGPVEPTTTHHDDRGVEFELNTLRNQLRMKTPPAQNREWWNAERVRLMERLNEDGVVLERPSSYANDTWNDVRRLEDDLGRHQDEIGRLRKLEDDLQHSLALRESEWEKVRHYDHSLTRSHNDSFRMQLRDIDDRLQQWRQTQQEVRTHRHGLQRSYDDLRLDLQLDGGPHAEPRRGLDALETQILNARRDFERILHRNMWDDRSSHYRSDRYFPDTLRSMQDGLYEVSQQIHRSETRNLTESLTIQIEQLERCDRELTQCIEQLIAERGTLLKRIAEDYQIPFDRLSLALGDWSQCQAHPHLYDWLAHDRDRRPHEASSWRDIEQLRSELQRTRTRLEDTLRSCHECERKLKALRLRSETTPVHVHRLTPAERRELELHLSRVEEVLRQWNERSELEARIAALESRSRVRIPARLYAPTMFWSEVDRYYHALHGESLHGRAYSAYQGSLNAPMSSVAQAYRSSVPGLNNLDHYTSRSLAELAFRMAIADLVANHFGRVPMLVDDGLQGLRGSALENVIRALKQFSVHGQQVIVFTSEDEVASRVRAHQGWVCFLNGEARTNRRFVDVRPAQRPAMDANDVNRQLQALANEHQEAPFEYVPYRKPVAVEPRVVPQRTSKYFLHITDSIDMAPRVDASLSHRFREARIFTVGDLLDTAPERLSSIVGLKNYEPGQLRDIQAQARLMCHVPRLRAFDARLLVECGIYQPSLLASIHPTDLMHRVREFVATPRGQQVMRSGNEYEVNRIRTWLESGNVREVRHPRDAARPFYESSRELERERVFMNSAQAAVDSHSHVDQTIDQDRSSRDRMRAERLRRRYDRSERTPRADRERRSSAHDASQKTSAGAGFESRGREERREASERTERSNRPERAERQERPAQQRRVVRMSGETQRAESTVEGWRFYLELNSPIVDAPSIGRQMADLLEAIGVNTVADLLAAEAGTLADRLQHRRTNRETIIDWQHQSRLMCRIPNLRGHDAQLLVAAGIHTPEQLTAASASELFTRVNRVATSKQGQRFLRGSQAPDQAEISDWLKWAQHCRPLKAA